MEKRTSPVVWLALVASLWMLPAARAQDLLVTNLDQLVAEAFSADHSFYLALSPWDWRGYALDAGAWWLDCSQLSCEDLFQTPTELSPGVQAYSVVLLQNPVTGETTILPDGSSVVIATIAAPSGYQPVISSWNRWMWNWYAQVVDQPDVWGLSPGEIPPPVIRRTALLADVSNYAAYAAYESNLEAQAEAEAAATASANMSGRLTPMDDEDDDGGDPCSITSLTQPFFVTGITAATNQAISISFQSCQVFRYLIFSADSLSTNTQWVSQAYVWGATNASSTTWTDTSTTNTDGSAVTQRFYRVQRILNSQIGAGAEHSVAVTQGGGLWAWGRNDGNLGDGLDSGIQVNRDYVEEYLPYPGDVANVTTCGAQAISNAVGVATGGDDFTVVVDNAGGVWTFGEDTHGQLGLGLGGYDSSGVFTDETLYPVPARIAGLSDIVSVAAGFDHALALRADGVVFAWGSDGNNDPERPSIYGQLGVGGLASGQTNAPIRSLVPTGTVIVAIAAGGYHSLALDVNGRVWTFGQGTFGQLGNGRTTNVFTPAMLTSISNVIAIAAGNYHSIALTADKTCWTWGDTYLGELGRTGDNTVPGQVPPSMLSNVVAIAGGLYFTAAVTSNGYVYGWGDNSQAELATNSTDVPFTNSPMQVVGMSNAVCVSAPVEGDGAHSGFDYDDLGGTHVVAMTLDQGTNHYYGWGDNNAGEVGNGVSGFSGGAFVQYTNQYAPAQVEFCTRCQRTVQLGTSGSFTAQCDGTLYLYFNGEIGDFGNYSGSYTATVNSVTTNVPAFDNTGYGIGVAIGTVTVGNVYTFSASGLCLYNNSDPGTASDPNGNGTNGAPRDCSDFTIINKTNAVCPTAQCFSLVGKIQ